LHETKEEHTHIELEGDIGVEHVECIGTQCEGRINLPQEQGETMCFLEAEPFRNEVSPVRPYEVEPLHDAKGYMPSLGGYRNPGNFWANTSPRCECPRVC